MSSLNKYTVWWIKWIKLLSHSLKLAITITTNYIGLPLKKSAWTAFSLAAKSIKSPLDPPACKRSEFQYNEWTGQGQAMCNTEFHNSDLWLNVRTCDKLLSQTIILGYHKWYILHLVT